jgi:hypothetical protein
MSSLVVATEGCCKGHPCDNCTRYIREGWTCETGTLTGEDVSVYLRSLRRERRVSPGFWAGSMGKERGKLLLRFVLQHIVGITARVDIVHNLDNVQDMMKRLRLERWVATHFDSYFAAIDFAFPELELAPWELRQVPAGFWDRPHTLLAGLRWFLNKQGWSPVECARQLNESSTGVRSQLRSYGLGVLYENLQIFDFLKELDQSLDLAPKNVIWDERRIKQESEKQVECPFCHQKYRSLKPHIRQIHRDVSPEEVARLLGHGASMQATATRIRLSRASRLVSARNRPSMRITSRGLVIPVEEWVKTRWVALHMQEWSEALELRPLNILPLDNTVVVAATPIFNTSVCIYIPKQIINSVVADTAVRNGQNKTVTLRFRSDEARQIVWDWYQCKLAKRCRYEITPEIVAAYCRTHTKKQAESHLG